MASQRSRASFARECIIRGELPVIFFADKVFPVALVRYFRERKVEPPVFFAHNTPPKYLEDHCRRKHLGDWVRYHAGWGRIDT